MIAESRVCGNGTVSTDSSELFLNHRHLEVDIGCGNALFLTALAKRYPATNFIGIEQRTEHVRRARNRKDSLELPNLFIVNAHAISFVLGTLKCESVHTFYINFPDPWPKRKHRRRRLLTAEFLKLLHSRLTENGFVHIATDDEDYYKFIRMQAAVTSYLWSSIRDRTVTRFVHEDLRTRYEEQFQREGKTLHYLELKKHSD